MTLEEVWNFPTLLSSWFYTDPVANWILVIIVLILFTITIIWNCCILFKMRKKSKMKSHFLITLRF